MLYGPSGVEGRKIIRVGGWVTQGGLLGPVTWFIGLVGKVGGVGWVGFLGHPGRPVRSGHLGRPVGWIRFTVRSDSISKFARSMS